MLNRPPENFSGPCGVADRQQRHHRIAEWQAQNLAHPLLLKSLHRSGVVTQRLGHQHHAGEGDHHMPVEPHWQIRMVREIFRDRDLGLLGIILRHTAFASQLKHLLKVAFAPAVGVPASNDHRRSLFHFGLVVARRPQPFSLLRCAHHHKSPWLQVVPARRLQPRFDDPFQIVSRYRAPIKAGGCPARRDRLT